jgi:hypothetical protein
MRNCTATAHRISDAVKKMEVIEKKGRGLKGAASVMRPGSLN